MRFAAFALLAVSLPLIAREVPDGITTFRPIVKPTLPPTRTPGRTAIDRFILAPLEKAGQTLNPEADRLTLIRRVSFDLTGLPPTLAEIDSFVSDLSTNAYEKLVEHYLSSPAYGERAGKFWLDAAGYSDSNGYFNADSDRPLAWRYRDYVIKAFNTDKPFDRFIREQIAGDELVGYRPGGDVTPAMVESLVATHFLRNAPDGTGESDGNPDEVRTDRFTVLEGNIQNLMNCLMGITVQCAKCHDHKFEPMSQEEYYQLQAILFPVYNPDRWSKPNERTVSIGTRAEIAAWNGKNAVIDRQIQSLENGMKAFTDSLREQMIRERLNGEDESTRDAVVAASRVAKAKRTPEQKKLIDKHSKAIDINDVEMAKRFPDWQELQTRIKQSIAAREKERPAPLQKLAVFVETDPNPPSHHLLRRGQHNQPDDPVKPGVLVALSTAKNAFALPGPKSGTVSTGRRTAFANWLTSPENPLLARVYVNRIWQHHFGTGIVATPDNLGISGARPSHPELLDYLAHEFVNQGWSTKALHRQILHSSVYRQSSDPKPAFREVDPDNRLLASFPVRRLDAEAVRDAMLQLSGELDATIGGPYIPSHRTGEGVVEVPENKPGSRRRSVYLQQRRTQVVTFLQIFDSPTIVTTCGKRTPSTVPLQSLALLNSEFVRKRGEALASRVLKEAGTDPRSRLDLVFRLISGRPPFAQERLRCEKFLVDQKQVYLKEKDPESRSWADLAQMLLSSHAFLYVE